MSRTPHTISLIDYRPPGSRTGRWTRSSLFAWGLSLAVHLGVFSLLYFSVFREASGPTRTIVPEARLAELTEPVEATQRNDDSSNWSIGLWPAFFIASMYLAEVPKIVRSTSSA